MKLSKPLTQAQILIRDAWIKNMQWWPGGKRFFLPVKLDAGANLREHFMVAAKRKETQRGYGALAVKLIGPTLPCTVFFTRYSSRQLDDDNLPNCFKHVRDGIAKSLHTDDSPLHPIRWRYAQEKAPHCHGFTVEWTAG